MLLDTFALLEMRRAKRIQNHYCMCYVPIVDASCLNINTATAWNWLSRRAVPVLYGINCLFAVRHSILMASIIVHRRSTRRNQTQPANNSIFAHENHTYSKLLWHFLSFFLFSLCSVCKRNTWDVKFNLTRILRNTTSHSMTLITTIITNYTIHNWNDRILYILNVKRKRVWEFLENKSMNRTILSARVHKTKYV